MDGAELKNIQNLDLHKPWAVRRLFQNSNQSSGKTCTSSQCLPGIFYTSPLPEYFPFSPFFLIFILNDGQNFTILLGIFRRRPTSRRWHLLWQVRQPSPGLAVGIKHGGFGWPGFWSFRNLETPLQKLFYSFQPPRDGTQEKDADRAVHVMYYYFLPQQGSRPQRGFQGLPRNRLQMFSSYVQCFLSMEGDRGSWREGEVNPGILSGRELDRGGRRHVSVEE